MEIELKPQALKNIIGYFDFDALQKSVHGKSIVKSFGADFFDDYLSDNPRALDELPAYLRNQLTDGLKLENTVVHKPQALLNADGKPLNGEVKLILPGDRNAKPAQPAQTALKAPALVLPKADPAVESRGGLLVHKDQPGSTSDWQTLYARWKALSPGLKESVARWENLAPIKKADLAISYAGGDIQPKSTLPPEERLLLERLEWAVDQDALEFKHKETLTVTSPEEFFRDAVQLAKRAGVEQEVLSPEEARLQRVRMNPGDPSASKSSLNFHVSVQDADLREIGVAFNRLALVRRVNLGILNDLTHEGRFIYQHSPKGRGLVRVIGANRIEFRAHTERLHDELELVTHALSLGPEKGLALVNAEIKRQMSDYVVDQFMKHAPAFPADFLDYMSPAQLERVAPRYEQELYLKRILQEHRGLPKDFWARAPELMASPSPIVQTRFAVALLTESGGHWPDEVWERMPKLLESQVHLVKAAAFAALEGQWNWSEKFWEKVPALMINDDVGVEQGITRLMKSQGVWPKVVWDRLPAMMTSEVPATRQRAIFLLKDQHEWPKEVWDKIPEMSKAPDGSDISAVHELVRGRTPPGEVTADCVAHEIEAEF
jgi:hypothetical protein